MNNDIHMYMMERDCSVDSLTLRNVPIGMLMFLRVDKAMIWSLEIDIEIYILLYMFLINDRKSLFCWFSDL